MSFESFDDAGGAEFGGCAGGFVKGALEEYREEVSTRFFLYLVGLGWCFGGGVGCGGWEQGCPAYKCFFWSTMVLEQHTSRNEYDESPQTFR